MTSFRTNPKTWEEIRRILQRIRTQITDTLGTMSKQNSNNVSITGGTISGSDIDLRGKTLMIDDQQIALPAIGTEESDTTKVVIPDGEGGLGFSEPGAFHDRLHDFDSPDDHTGISGATAGNFISLDEAGLPQDSGYSPESLGAGGSRLKRWLDT